MKIGIRMKALVSESILPSSIRVTKETGVPCAGSKAGAGAGAGDAPLAAKVR